MGGRHPYQGGPVGPCGGRGRQRSQRGTPPAARTRPATVAAGTALLLAGLLLVPKLGQAQGNAGLIIRQMQAQIAALNATVQRQRSMIQQLNQNRASDNSLLLQLQTAVIGAAAAGDPQARAVRSASAVLTVEKLTAQFQARSQPGAAAASASSVDTTRADLSGARLRDAILRAVKLPNANLSGADLTGADLAHATLTGANLRGARLQRAILTAADLTKADLTGALYDSQTKWPTGLDPAQRGALLVQ